MSSLAASWRRRSLLAQAFALLVIVAGAGGCVSSRSVRETKRAEPRQPAPEPPALPGRDEYEKAKQAVVDGDTRGAVQFLEQATQLDAQVCEYWYQLGAAKSNLAIEVVNQRLRLMDLGECHIWTQSQQEQARADGEAGLADADAVMQDPASLVMALKMYAAQR
jgi:hypothetical protein